MVILCMLVVMVKEITQRLPKGYLWIPGKFYRTVGDADAETVIN